MSKNLVEHETNDAGVPSLCGSGVCGSGDGIRARMRIAVTYGAGMYRNYSLDQYVRGYHTDNFLAQGRNDAVPASDNSLRLPDYEGLLCIIS